MSRSCEPTAHRCCLVQAVGGQNVEPVQVAAKVEHALLGAGGGHRVAADRLGQYRVEPGGPRVGAGGDGLFDAAPAISWICAETFGVMPASTTSAASRPAITPLLSLGGMFAMSACTPSASRWAWSFRPVGDKLGP
jgi:hypothetical protein